MSICLAGIESFLMYANKTEIQGLMLEDNASQDIKALAPISKIKQATAIDFYSGRK